ncbi:putative methyltransferase NSUN6 [Paramicrosporidium saccamoebae]|uniref:Putative methyltransferase NSUN6 n=1 Tax=Paramicrosporidium saccamoebae TaxID=1246581 RepID=A0A2H9TJJ4_9FUNG|nr:putative methyltransferase NSUN6 [Paramicrosporidium saccamoebae]
MEDSIDACELVAKVLTSFLTVDQDISHDQIIHNAEFLLSPPTMSVLRVNTLQSSPEAALTKAAAILHAQDSSFCAIPLPGMPEVLTIKAKGPLDVIPTERQAIVSVECAQAVLRGAHVFGPGVIAIQDDATGDSAVSVWADLDEKCTRGFRKIYGGRKKFVGNGILKMPSKGLAIEMIQTKWKMPSFEQFPRQLYFPQNLPSILVVEELAPRPGEIVLDMCASPGGKSSHIGIKMKNTGLLISLDKNINKVNKLKDTLAQQSVTSARAYIADASKLLSADGLGVSPAEYSGGTDKLLPNSFSRICLDPPCSGFGQRPLIPASSYSPNLRGYASYQMKMVSTACALLKSGGCMSYSTCTMVPDENEQVVAYAVQELGMQLETPRFGYGSPGLSGFGLSDSECEKVKRFWPAGLEDTIGFFYAVLKKP